MSEIRVAQHPTQSTTSFTRSTRPVKPLTHHEILRIVGPFARRDRHVDLAASDRNQRRLVFPAAEHEAPAGFPYPLTEQLILEVAETRWYRLTRELRLPSGLTSVVVAEGADADALLQVTEALPLARQFDLAGGVPIARHYALEPVGSPDTSGSIGIRAVITGATARVAGVNCAFQADRVRGAPLELKLTTDPGSTLHIPADLVAVLGWRWRPLEHFGRYWRCNIGVRTREPRRTPDIEAKLARTVAHLAETFSAPPAAFHRRHTGARWRVAFQRAIPLLITIVVLGATVGLQRFDIDSSSSLWMLLFHAPPFVLVAVFLLPEIPRIEFPPLPRRLRAPQWLETLADSEPVEALEASHP